MEVFEALEKYKAFIYNLKVAYIQLIWEFKKNDNNENLYSGQFFSIINTAFRDGINNSTFINIIIKKILTENDLNCLELIYNNLIIEITDLKNSFTQNEFNPKYPYSTASDKTHTSASFYLHKLICIEDVNNNEKREYFYADDLYNDIHKNLDFTINSINEMFKKKPITPTQNDLKPSNQPTPPQKQIKPIKWLKNSNLLAYLINELKTYGFIDEDSIWAICEQLFVDKKGLPIKAQTFTSMVKNYEAITMYDEKGNPTTQKGKPKTHTEITELIKTLKALSKDIE